MKFIFFVCVALALLSWAFLPVSIYYMNMAENVHSHDTWIGLGIYAGCTCFVFTLLAYYAFEYGNLKDSLS